MSRDRCQDCGKSMTVAEIKRLAIEFIRAERDGDIDASGAIISQITHQREYTIFALELAYFAGKVPDEVMGRTLAVLDKQHPRS